MTVCRLMQLIYDPPAGLRVSEQTQRKAYNTVRIRYTHLIVKPPRQ